MGDWQGLYTEYFNTVYTNYPPQMRKRAPSELIVAYDNIFKSAIDKVMPRKSGPSIEGGKTISVNTPFTIPITSDPQYMAPYADIDERPGRRAIAYRFESYQASLIMEDGPQFNPFEFTDELVPAFMDFNKQFLITSAVKSLNRRIEFDSMKFIHGNTVVHERFGQNIQTGRKKTLNATGTELTGITWSAYQTADPLYDISQIKYYANEMDAGPIKFGFIGTKTMSSLEKNAVIKDLLKYTVDLTNTTIGASLAGVQFDVINTTYKNANTSSLRPTSPFGDVRETTWARDTRTRIMTEVEGTGTLEFGLFAPERVGNVMTARVHPDQGDSSAPYLHTWKDEEHSITKSRFSLGFTPFVDDWAKVIIVKALALR